jgi:repressor of nif and glnA expression
VSRRVVVRGEGERVGDLVVPKAEIGFATVCSIVINGCLLKAGIPMDSKFGGILQMRKRKPLRFVDLIHYAGSSLDPSEAFIRARMTDVRGAAREGHGKVLANFREIPSSARQRVEDVTQKLGECGFGGVMSLGLPNEPVCEVPVGPNRVGVVLMGGLTPVAAVQEEGMDLRNRPMSGIVEYQELEDFDEVLEKYASPTSGQERFVVSA